MTRAEEYRHLAQKVRARASREQSPLLKAEWEHLAESYVQLAKQTEENDRLDPIWDPIVGTLQAKIRRTIQ
jgi:hypothetical protein